jgi:hypothetical protein
MQTSHDESSSEKNAVQDPTQRPSASQVLERLEAMQAEGLFLTDLPADPEGTPRPTVSKMRGTAHSWMRRSLSRMASVLQRQLTL